MNDANLLWREDESLRLLERRLNETPRSISVVSFDFFDTLVCRVCPEPPDLFIEVGRQLARGDQLRLPLTPPEFRAARIAADERAREHAARRGRPTEIVLADIYRELGEVVRDPAAARDLEFATERRFCYLNPAMASLVQHVRSLGLRTAVLSDTYFTAAELRQLLRDNGLSPSLFDAIIASSEHGHAKWNGLLYHTLCRELDIHPNELLHIGDNRHADVHTAARHRVEPVHYYRTTPNLDAIFQGERRQRGPDAAPAATLDSLRVMAARRAESESDPFRDGAFVFGPVLTRYADWCVEHFKAAGVRTVLALMREGEVLGQLVEQAAAAAGVELNVVPCFASRLATARAAMTEITPERAAELMEGSAGLCPQTVLEILGLGREAGQFLDAAALRKPLAGAEGVHGFLKLLFQLPRLRRLLEERRQQSHELAFEYLTNLAGDAATVGVVDLGWSGSIQRNLARILRRGGRPIRTVGCYLACTRRAGRLALDGDVAHAFMEHEWARSTILAEVAITATIGSTDGYLRDPSGRVVPVLGRYETTPEEQRVKERLREGIFAFQSLWLELRARKGADTFSAEMLADIDAQTAPIFYRLLEFPTKPEAERLGGLRHDENYFGESYSAPLCDDEASAAVRRGGVQALVQKASCYWPQGVLARVQPRLVSSLRSPWSEPLMLGRSGATSGPGQPDPGFTADELASLAVLRETLPFEQIVFAGAFSPALENLFPEAGAPQWVFLRAAELPAASAAFASRSVCVPGDLAAPAAHRAVRAALRPGATGALVIPGDTPEAETRALLNALAPFLGPRGLVLVACGRYDRFTVEGDAPVAQVAAQWFETAGVELGYDVWSGTSTDRPHVWNWIVFRRQEELVLVNDQWMFSLEDLAYSEPPGIASA